MSNFKVQWIGTTQGYSIEVTDERADYYEIFDKYIDAKESAVEKARNDFEATKLGLKNTRSIKKTEVV